jgi:glucose-1-phosphate thymidylyltransferase
MKVIIPLAGKGTRLKPHTNTKPKPLMHVAGKPVLGHILDRIKKLDIEEVIFITGHLGNQIEDYIKKNYPFKSSFVEQKEMLGDGHAISLAKDMVKEGDVLVIFVDTIFETDLSVIEECKTEGVVFVKGTDDPRRFGIVTVDEDDVITSIEEKPQNPRSNLAVIGLYYFKDAGLMFKYLKRAMDEKISSKGEYRLADAIWLMLRDNHRLNSAVVKEWLDCGAVNTLLSTNKYLLDHGSHKETKTSNSVIIPPVYIESNVKINDSVIGPYVSVAGNSVISNSIIKNSIINENAHVENVVLEESLIGENAVVEGRPKKFNVGDSSHVTS